MTEEKKKKIYFRADGDSQIGLGHLIRVSSVAACVNNEYQCILVTRCELATVLDDLRSTFEEIIHLPQKDYKDEANSIAALYDKSLFVLDGYSFDSEYQNIITKSGHSLFFIDDIHAFNYSARTIINQSGNIKASDYKALPGTQYYFGPRFSMLRKPFLDVGPNRRKNVDNNFCFVCFGGADPGNKTLEVLTDNKIAEKFEHFHVVVGGANKHLITLEKLAENNINISLYKSISADEMVSVMAKCSFAICSPSSVVYEFMSVGGGVFLEKIADNQNDVIQFLLEDGLAFALKDLGEIDENKIANSLEKQALFFDGKSGERILKIFHQFFESQKFAIRHITLSDLITCYEWANDKEVRAQSFNQSTIDLAIHSKWFTNKLNDKNSFFYIIEMEQTPVAQIRFDVKGREALIGYLADKSIRSKGLGTAILSMGIETFVKEFGKSISIIGYVKDANIASQRSFERLAFEKENSLEYQGSFKYTMYYEN